jgi:D-arabinose 1-dehydrogenase-like Zn-dependent alcohol dehydrogenase
MRGVTFPGDRQVGILNFPDPTPGPGEVVLEMRASGMCGSDLHTHNGCRRAATCVAAPPKAAAR